MSELPTSPACQAARRELNAFVDGELAPEEGAVIERHLEGCAACRAEVDLLRVITHSLSLIPRPEPPEWMRQRLLAQVAAELPSRRFEAVCIERHGDRVIHRREVRTYNEPDRLRRLGPSSESVVVPVVQQFRRVLTDHPNCYQVIVSHYRRENYERCSGRTGGTAAGRR